MVENIYALKESCPRDLGPFYCNDCLKRYKAEQGETDFLVSIYGCGQEVDGSICGKTHLGYGRCKECKESGQDSKHIGQYEIVGQVKDKQILCFL